MPTYEYECKKCGHRFNKFQSINDKPVKKCPLCKGAVQRLISSGAGIVFKGSGFYKNDYSSRPADKGSACSGQDSCGTCPMKDN